MKTEPLKDKEMSNKNQYRSFNQIVNIFYNEEVEGISSGEELNLKNKETIKIKPKKEIV